MFVGTVPLLTKDLDKIGTRVGMALTMISFGPLTGPSVAGTLIARTLLELREAGKQIGKRVHGSELDIGHFLRETVESPVASIIEEWERDFRKPCQHTDG